MKAFDFLRRFCRQFSAGNEKNEKLGECGEKSIPLIENNKEYLKIVENLFIPSGFFENKNITLGLGRNYFSYERKENLFFVISENDKNPGHADIFLFYDENGEYKMWSVAEVPIERKSIACALILLFLEIRKKDVDLGREIIARINMH